jgi:hypothetical protein
LSIDRYIHEVSLQSPPVSSTAESFRNRGEPEPTAKLSAEIARDHRASGTGDNRESLLERLRFVPRWTEAETHGAKARGFATTCRPVSHRFHHATDVRPIDRSSGPVEDPGDALFSAPSCIRFGTQCAVF